MDVFECIFWCEGFFPLRDEISEAGTGVEFVAEFAGGAWAGFGGVGWWRGVLYCGGEAADLEV